MSNILLCSSFSAHIYIYIHIKPKICSMSSIKRHKCDLSLRKTRPHNIRDLTKNSSRTLTDWHTFLLQKARSTMSNPTISPTITMPPPVYETTPLLSHPGSIIRHLTEDHPVPSHHHHQPQPWRWFVLLALSLLNFINGAMWITFAPCLYVFARYYFGDVAAGSNAINSLSVVYFVVYPILIYPSFQYFVDPKGSPIGTGLKRGVMIGAVLNVAGAWLRYLGAVPSVMGFAMLFVGQTVAAIAQVFIIGVPPRLAVAWFEAHQINLATAIAVTANGLGVAAGFGWTPLMVHETTAETDIPNVLFAQFIWCFVILILVWIGFQYPPNVRVNIELNKDEDKVPVPTASSVWTNRSFVLMMSAYGIIVGAQSALTTLLAQVLMPPFRFPDETQVGWLGFYMLLAGVPSSMFVGWFLDRTFLYRDTCRWLYATTTVSLCTFHVAIEREDYVGVLLSR
ncbi:major facilitator superfamily domain-containing protein [Jimgerdemannia flammicorona]|uniref:Major facilitator superfamily domain-containing protein n=1 Tax=Jimgerdemannia flammicorona TaxID=994334 RepID=A0A433PBQ9_9FUNG|nr:major facilitator superfamily domain-containing protein [Jimgerdemannia flammicorona]